MRPIGGVNLGAARVDLVLVDSSLGDEMSLSAAGRDFETEKEIKLLKGDLSTFGGVFDAAPFVNGFLLVVANREPSKLDHETNV